MLILKLERLFNVRDRLNPGSLPVASLATVIWALLFSHSALPGQTPAKPVVANQWEPAGGAGVEGVLGERLRLWRKSRLVYVAENPLLVGAFGTGEGSHAVTRGSGQTGQGESMGSSPLWQGEHIGKWLHAATLAYQTEGDSSVLRLLKKNVAALLAAQEKNGYLGTYAPPKRFYAPPDNDTWRSWDIWTQRYNLYGLLTYERFHPDNDIVAACTRIGDLLLTTFGPGKRDMTEIGTRRGMSSTTVLESVMMLYERTGEKRFLEFAQHIVRMSENNPKLRLLSAMLAGEDVSGPGDGKAYQLMANLLGYGELYRFSGKPEYLRAATSGWDNIRKGHVFESGGPWSYKSADFKNQECFAPPDQFHPSNVVETCSATTWVQLSLQLLRLTGEAKYAAEAERAILNQLLSAQSPDGISWATHPPANTPARKFLSLLDCCASSGPRALEMYARHLVGFNGNTLALGTYLPMKVKLPNGSPNVRALAVAGGYPFSESAAIELQLPKAAQFAVDFAVPSGAESIRITVNGKPAGSRKLETDFHRVERRWSPGEKIGVEFEFPVRAHAHRGRDGRRWVAFTRGPVLLAREFSGGEAAEVSIPAQAAAKPGEWIERVPDSRTAYKIRNMNATLVPYYAAGSKGNGVQTYFPERP